MKQKHLLRSAMSDMEKRERAVMERLFLLMAHNTKRTKSFHEYEHALFLLNPALTDSSCGGCRRGRCPDASVKGFRHDPEQLDGD